MAVTVTHSLAGPDVDAFDGRIDDLVETCVAFKPKALSVLKEAADGLIRGLAWPPSPRWFERVLAGLEQYGWPGANLHRRFLGISVVQSIDALFEVGADEIAEERTEILFTYLDAMFRDDFGAAAVELNAIEAHIATHNSVATASTSYGEELPEKQPSLPPPRASHRSQPG